MEKKIKEELQQMKRDVRKFSKFRWNMEEEIKDTSRYENQNTLYMVG